MIKQLLIAILLLFRLSADARQDRNAISGIIKFQQELNAEFKDKTTSPLEGKALRKFKSLPFYEPDTTYIVRAHLVRTDTSKFTPFKTTTDRMASNRIFGYVEFTLRHANFRVPVYQSESLMNKSGLNDYLFFPFTDLTNGETTYGAGRYIDLRIPVASDYITIDFNKAYNPSCAYNHKYSCPIVPPANHLSIRVDAGVRFLDASHSSGSKF